MKEYLLVIITVLALAWIREHTYVGSVHSLATRNKDRLCLLLIFLVLALFVGLRIKYNDTYQYVLSYQNAEGFPAFWSSFKFTLSSHPGYLVFRAWLKTKQVSTQGFLLITAAFSVACSLYFIKRFSNHLILSLFLFFSTNAYTLSAAAIKQSLAIALSLIAIDFAVKKKWVLFWLLLLVAVTFHPYALVFSLVPVLMFRPWGKRTYFMLVSFLFLGFALESVLGTIVDITTMIGESYSEESFIGDGINIFRVMVANVPLVLTFIYRRTLFRDSTEAENLMVNLAMINGAIMFVGMFGTAIYFSRMASYVTITQCIVLPWILSKLPRDRRNFYTMGMVVGYTGFFLYANVISQSFDQNFSRMTLMEYLSRYVFS